MNMWMQDRLHGSYVLLTGWVGLCTFVAACRKVCCGAECCAWAAAGWLTLVIVVHWPWNPCTGFQAPGAPA